MTSQRGYIHAQEIGIREGDARGHFVLAGIGPKGGNRRYLWLSTEETQALMVRCAKALAADAVNRSDLTAAREALGAVDAARDEVNLSVYDVKAELEG